MVCDQSNAHSSDRCSPVFLSVIATAEPQKKRVDGVTALMVLSAVNREQGSAIVKPSEWVYTMN